MNARPSPVRVFGTRVGSGSPYPVREYVYGGDRPEKRSPRAGERRSTPACGTTAGYKRGGMIAAVLEDSHESWLEDAVATIIGLARAGQQFDADDLHREMRPAPSPKLPGIAFSMARKSGHITTVGYRQSSTKSRKNGVIRVWTATKEKQ